MSSVGTTHSGALIETGLTGQLLLDNPVLNKGSAFSQNERRESRKVALAVGVEAQQAGLTETTSLDELERNVRDKMWRPHDVPLSIAAS